MFDPLSSLLAVMSKASEKDRFLIQLALNRAPSGWQSSAQRAIDKGIPISEEEKKPLPGEALIKQKIEEMGLKVGIRIASNSEANLKSLIDALSPLSRGDGNSLGFQKPNLWQKAKLKKAILMVLSVVAVFIAHWLSYKFKNFLQ